MQGCLSVNVCLGRTCPMINMYSINVSVVHMAQDVMILMWANSFRGPQQDAMQNTEYRIQNAETHVHKITNVPVFLYLKFWWGVNPLLGHWKGFSLKIKTFRRPTLFNGPNYGLIPIRREGRDRPGDLTHGTDGQCAMFNVHPHLAQVSSSHRINNTKNQSNFLQ